MFISRLVFTRYFRRRNEKDIKNFFSYDNDFCGSSNQQNRGL